MRVIVSVELTNLKVIIVMPFTVAGLGYCWLLFLVELYPFEVQLRFVKADALSAELSSLAQI